MMKNTKMRLLGNKPIFGIEAGVINGWEKYINKKNFVGMSSFGESGPYKELFEHFNITDQNLIEKIIKNFIITEEINMRVAINGFGRIGKLVFRAFLEKKSKMLK